MQNRAIILAAGRGSRMGAETAHKPKCLTSLAGKKLLEWQLDTMKGAGIQNITVVRGYRSEMLKGEFSTIDNKRWEKTNMLYSLFCVPSFKGNTIISYSDIVFKKDHIINLNKSNADITITADKQWEELWRLRFDDPFDDAETFKSNGEILLEIGEKTRNLDDIEAQYMGLIKLTENGWNIINEVYQSLTDNEKDKMDMTSLLNLLIKKRIDVKIVFVKGGWCECDAYSDVIVYEKELKENKNWIHNWQ